MLTVIVPATPGVGFGMGLERVALALEDEGIEPPAEPALQVFIVAIGENARARATELLRALRGAGVRATGPGGPSRRAGSGGHLTSVPGPAGEAPAAAGGRRARLLRMLWQAVGYELTFEPGERR